jgi:hypothetical protein
MGDAGLACGIELAEDRNDPVSDIAVALGLNRRP